MADNPIADVVAARIVRPAREGTGLVDDPRDPGGITHCGITIPFLSDRLGRAATPDDIRALTPATAVGHYRAWMTVFGFDQLADLSVMDALTDYAVQHGEGPAVRALQHAVGADVDGYLGPMTIAATNAANSARVFALLCASRCGRWADDIEARPVERAYAVGFLRRMDDLLSA